MNLIGTIILGIVQGITEFLPVSSSAHLIIIRYLFNIYLDSNIELTFDLALHFGTLLSILVYFFYELIKMLISGLKFTDKLLWKIGIATLPAAFFGFLLEDIVDNFFRKKIILIAIILMLFGIIIYFVDKKSLFKKNIDTLSFKDAIFIGVCQILALIPGFSRSGTTITASRFVGVNREDSIKFSFYLSIPIVFGAFILTLFKENTLAIITTNLNIFGIGFLVSFITGLLSISFLLKYIKTNDFKMFMIYRIIVGLIVILLK